MITREKNFKTSVNIRFDLGKEEFANRYLPTPSHAESLLGLLKGFNNPIDNKRSHIIVGPYGTGKSLIATIVGSLTAKRLDETTAVALARKFNKVHDDIYEELQKIGGLNQKYLTVVLNGNEGRFRESLLNAIIRTVNDYGIDLVLPGYSGQILEIIDMWEIKFPKAYRLFKKILKDSNKDFKIWRLAVMNQDKKEIDWFLSIYPELTNGARFNMQHNENFIEQVSYILKELNKQGIGIFIAYDEFGRLLQTLEPNEIHETMQDLQDLAELTDHSSENLHVLLITHKNLRQYFNLLNDDFRNEFQRIEKRFKVYYVESDKATFIRLADNVIRDIRPDEFREQPKTDIMMRYLRKYPLFLELNQQEIEEIVIKGIFPLHPVALYLLPYLSSYFGQNERTLFTFLESNESGGLLNFLNKSKGYYLASDLFDYFFPSIQDLDVNNVNLNALKIYKSVIIKIRELRENDEALKLIKFITMWQLAGLQGRIKLDTDFLCFALDIRTDIITTLLKELSLLKIIRYNRVLGYWELSESSSFQIEQLIYERLQQTFLDKNRKLEVLQHCLSQRFFFSNEYNNKKSMTRYAAVEFLTSTDISENIISWKNKREQLQSDAVVYYVLLDSPHRLSSVMAELRDVRDKLSIFCISELPFTAIEEQLGEYVVIESLLQDQELLNQDKNLKQELLLWKEDLNFIISDFLSKYTSYGKDVVWLHQGMQINIKSEIALENMLSRLMDEAYPDTPEVRNDSLNRRNLNNVQRKAAQMVIDHIINSYSEINLGIQGQGPDYLIYATVFKNNKLDIKQLDSIVSAEFKKLRFMLKEHVEQNNTGTLKDFVNLMIKKPFGIRESLIPLYLVALLRDKWDHIMFYRNNLFVSGINGEKLYKMLEESSEYHYVYYNFDNQYQHFFKSLQDSFGTYENELVKNKPVVIRISNSILTWLRSLPRITQTTEIMSQELIVFKDIVRRSEVNPQEALTGLFEKYGDDFEQLIENKNQLEQHFTLYKFQLAQEIYRLTGFSNLSQLYEWASEQKIEIQKQNHLISSILRCTICDNWLDEFVRHFIGIEINHWSDATMELFKNQLKADYVSTIESDIKHDDYLQLSYNGVVKTINKIELSTKSETIYKNVERMIKNAGRNVSKNEIEYLVLKLVDEFIE